MLAALGQVWSFIDWFHPDTERSGPWQDALFEAIPKVSNDLSDEGFADVLEKLLDHLDDPSTRLWKESRVKPNFKDLREGLPSGLRVILTGQSIKYPDGKRLQRVGLIPDIECRPTITGIRNGVDEVLNRAIEFLNDSKV
jgi:hypothetical protein